MNRKLLVPSLGIAVLALGACGLLDGEKGPPTYALVQLRHDATRIQMVTLMKTYSEPECNAAIEEYMNSFFEGDTEGWRQTERSCRQTLEELYQRVFNKEQFHATYVILSAKEDPDYDARVVLFGIPSSQAQQICEKVARDIERRMKVDAECVQGTIG